MSNEATYDVGERDPAFIETTLPLVRFYTESWHRAEVRGLEHLDGLGSALIVGNHSGGFMPPDAPVLAVSFFARFGVETPLFLLAHDGLFLAPGAQALRRWGIMPASRANTIAALRAGGSVLVFPGGDHEVARPSSEQGEIQLAERKGFIDVALTAGVPIVPMVSIGAQETQWFLSRGDWLAQLIPAARDIRMGVLPISFGFPFGLSVGGFPPNLPLPAKLVSEVLAPIDIRRTFGGDPDRNEVYAHVTAVMQETLTRLGEERRWPIVG